MKSNNQKYPNYKALSEQNKDDPEFSFFELSKRHQESIQSKVFRRASKTKQLTTELFNAAHAHASAFIKETSSAFETDCKQGCSYCCYQPATVFPFEAIQIASILKDSLTHKQLSTLVDRMKTRVNGLDRSSVYKNINNKTACPLLSKEQCSVYENRPLTCRLAHSFSVKRCRLSFEKDRFKVQIPVSIELQSGVSGIIEALYEQLPKENLDGNLYELCSAVLAALADDNAAEKWAKGDRSVFKDCIKDDT